MRHVLIAVEPVNRLCFHFDHRLTSAELQRSDGNHDCTAIAKVHTCGVLAANFDWWPRINPASMSTQGLCGGEYELRCSCGRDLHSLFQASNSRLMIVRVFG